MKEKLSHLKKYIWFFPVYLIGFVFLERSGIIKEYHIVQCAWDNMIPLVESFVIPYLMWHLSILLLSIYTFLCAEDKFEKMLRYFIFCSVICFLCFIIFPSAVNLRPKTFERDNVFTDILKIVYFLDTSTNTCPSMHVIGAFGLVFTAWNLKPFDNNAGRAFSIVLCVLICLSTVLIKQHSVIDVFLAFPVAAMGYWTCFTNQQEFAHGEFKNSFNKLFEKGKVFTVPNILSILRLLIIPMIVYCYKVSKNYYFAAGLVIFSGLTDIADGYIARHFDMGSNLGKILDPVADKATQIAIIYCLSIRFPKMWYLIVIIIVKELVQGTFGYVTLKKHDKVHSSKWYGKISTVCLYTMAFILFFFSSIDGPIVDAMIVFNIVLLILALIMYTRFYLKELYSEKIGEIILKLLKIFGFCLWAVLILFLLRYKNELTPERIASIAPKDMLLAALCIIAAFAVKSLTIVFYSGVLYAASGIIFPFPAAIVVNLAGMFVMISLPFFIGKKVGPGFVEDLKKKYPKINDADKLYIGDGFIFTLLIRLIQLLNYDIGSLYLGTVKIAYGKYVAGSLLAMLPLMLIYTFTGYNIKSASPVIPIVLVAYYIVSTAVSAFLLKRRSDIAVKESEKTSSDE